MLGKKLGRQTVEFSQPPVILASAAVVGQKEGQGPLRQRFDYIGEDSLFGCRSWEAAESAMLSRAFDTACTKAKISSAQLDYLLSGDLLNQCAGSTFAVRDKDVPFFGLYGACSNMAESLSLAAMLVDGGYADKVCAMTSSHFCSSERQFRTPLEYGAQRTPTAQWTVTGAGAAIVGKSGKGPRMTHVTTGRVVDVGIKDASNMGAAMAPAAAQTIKVHFEETGRPLSYYNAVITGDLGRLGHRLMTDLLGLEGIELPNISTDCGMLIFDAANQDVHCGGSGCGCSASVLCGHILRCMEEGTWNRVLFAATGALMSPTTTMQGESVPGICHAVAIENVTEAEL